MERAAGVRAGQGAGRRGAGEPGNPVDGTHRPNMPADGALATPGEAENKS